MSMKVSIMYEDPETGQNHEIASTIDPIALKAAKQSVLHLAKLKVASNTGYDVLEFRAELEYNHLKQLLDHVLPDC